VPLGTRGGRLKLAIHSPILKTYLLSIPGVQGPAWFMATAFVFDSVQSAYTALDRPLVHISRYTPPLVLAALTIFNFSVVLHSERVSSTVPYPSPNRSPDKLVASSQYFSRGGVEEPSRPHAACS